MAKILSIFVRSLWHRVEKLGIQTNQTVLTNPRVAGGRESSFCRPQPSRGWNSRCAPDRGVAGTRSSRYGDVIADKTGMGATWIGLLLVTTVTSLPELVTGVSAASLADASTLPEITVTIAALRLGALDLAVSNLLGSNLFNLLILAVDDLFYVTGALLSHVSVVQAVSALSMVMMNGVVIVGLLYRSKGRVFRTVGWASLVLLTIYLLNASFLFLYRG